MTEAGHNSTLYLAARLDVLEIVQPLQARRDEFIVKMDAKRITDRELAGDAADLLALSREFAGRVDVRRKAVTDPYRSAADAGKTVADNFLQILYDARERLAERLQTWTDEEDARIEAQRLEQQQAMRGMADLTSAPSKEVADIRRAAVLPAKRTSVRGDYGSKAVSTEKVTWSVTDVREVPLHILETETVKAAIAKVAETMGKHTKSIPGLERHVGSKLRIHG